MARPLTLRTVIGRLRSRHGTPEWPPASDPFELVLWENVAYLAARARRREAFETLKGTIGSSPRDILTATPEALERVTSRGILAATSAAKLRECARVAAEDLGGDLRAVVQGPPERARRALRSFPGIGAPGADKILLFAGRQALLAPESNGLRVLARLGLVREETSYARTYAASRGLEAGLSRDPRSVQEAHLLLQRHGQTLCRRTAPSCPECPLSASCAHAQSTRRRPAGRPHRPRA